MSYNSNYLRVKMIILISINIKIADNRNGRLGNSIRFSASIDKMRPIIILIGLYYWNVIVFCDCVDVYSKWHKKDEFQQIVQLCCSWCHCYNFRVLYLESVLRYKRNLQNYCLEIEQKHFIKRLFVGIFLPLRKQKERKKKYCEYPDDIMALNPTFILFSEALPYVRLRYLEITSD